MRKRGVSNLPDTLNTKKTSGRSQSLKGSRTPRRPAVRLRGGRRRAVHGAIEGIQTLNARNKFDLENTCSASRGRLVEVEESGSTVAQAAPSKKSEKQGLCASWANAEGSLEVQIRIATIMLVFPTFLY